MITEYAALHADEERFCSQIASFLGYGSYVHTAIAKTMALHYRTGELNEWDRVFTQEQIALTTALIPPRLAARFGWKLL